jgi:hypothetical protein
VLKRLGLGTQVEDGGSHADCKCVYGRERRMTLFWWWVVWLMGGREDELIVGMDKT